MSELRGTPTRVQRGGKAYWYDSYWIGMDVRKAYIGEDSPELRLRLEQSAAIAAAREDSQRHRSRLIRILRAEIFRC